MTLGVCTMPGCLSEAQWVHGTPLEDQGGAQLFPWELCDCCHEQTLRADRVLSEAGIAFPDEVQWAIEAARARNQRRLKMEASQ